MSASKLKLFEIKNLFNQYDVSIPLDSKRCCSKRFQSGAVIL